MTAQCAICDGVLDQGQKFLLIGAEVVHRECARSGRQTRGWKLQQVVAQTRAALARAQSDRSRADERSQRLQRELLDSQRELRQVAAARDLNREEVETWRRRAEDLAADVVDLKRQNRKADTSRNLVPEEPLEVVEPHVDSRDDSEIRFSLLDLDP